MKKINHKQLGELIKHYYEKKDNLNRKNALIVYGTFGVGKSAVIKATALELAEKKGKKFAEWNKMNNAEREAIFSNPSKYFVLMDIRLSEFDSSDIKGLPDFKDKQSIEWKVPYWAKLLENKDSDGILFFDEINLATPLVISSCYKIIYDRVINEGKISDDWLIVGAGNKDDDRAYTHDLASPVRDRGGEVELISPSAESWSNWASENEIDARIIGFVNFKPSVLHSVKYDDNQKFTTERGWARVNSLVKDEKDYDILELLSSSAIGEGIAREFVAFCKIADTIKLEEIIKTPEKIKTIPAKDIDIKYFVVSAIAERYKDKKIVFEKVMKISECLDEIKNAEFVALLWRLCARYSPAKFKTDFTTIKNDTLIKKYTKYLV